MNGRQNRITKLTIALYPSTNSTKNMKNSPTCAPVARYQHTLSLLDGWKFDKFTRKWQMSLKTLGSYVYGGCKGPMRENIVKMLRRRLLINLHAHRLYYHAQLSALYAGWYYRCENVSRWSVKLKPVVSRCIPGPADSGVWISPTGQRYFLLTTWYLKWYGMVWYGMVWYGMVWYGMVWYGMVWYQVFRHTFCPTRPLWD